MDSIFYFTLRCIRKIIGNKSNMHALKYYEYVDLYDQEANDYILRLLSNKNSSKLMISKFGSFELSHIVATYYELNGLNKEFFKDFFNYNVSYDLHRTLKPLCYNAGFFPYNIKLGIKFYNKMLQDMPEIDILASYIYEEKNIKQFLTGVKKRVNLDGFYAPFQWENPCRGKSPKFR